MKKICILSISLCLCFYLRAQFGTDVIVKQSGMESYYDPDAVEASNGNMFAVYLLDSAGIRGCEVAMSEDEGRHWEVVYRLFNPAYIIKKAAITSTDTGANEIVAVLIASQEPIGYTGFLDVFYFNANNGYYLTATPLESGITSQHGQIDIESDSKNINGSDGSIACIVAYSGDLADSVKYFYSNGAGFFRKKVATTGSGQVGNVHINYANNANFSNNIFMMAWEETYGNRRVFMATTGNNPTPMGTIATMRVDDDMPANTGILYKPYVLTQNNGYLGPTGAGSSGLLHGLLYLRDSTNANGVNILGNVNKNYSIFTSLVDSCNPEISTIQVGDYAAVNFGNEAHVVYYNKTNRHLRWKVNTNIINNPSAGFADQAIPDGRINDSPLITVFPDPVAIYSPTHNKPGFFWVDQISGKGIIKFDAPFIGHFAGVENHPAEKLQVFPNPVQAGENINITRNTEWNGDIQAELLNMNGQVEHQWTSTDVNAAAIWTLDLDENIAPGIYILRISGKEMNAVTKLVIK